jgi:beta-lactamase superfamily II metal-dependent hydrolase
MNAKPALATLVATAALALVARAGLADRTLEFYWVDSEGGGSTLIVTPAGESVLIDAGNPGGRDAVRILAAAKAAGVGRIDHFILTHYHLDHFGGLAEVAQQMPVGTIYQRAIPERDPDGRAQSAFPTQIKPYRELSAKRVALKPGLKIPLRQPDNDRGLSLLCLAADQQFIDHAEIWAPLNRRPSAAKPVPPSDNDNCAAFVLQYGAFRFFDGADLTWNLEARLVTPYNLAGAIDVYQTDHHGLDVSNNPVLLQTIAPSVVVMNNGPRKGGQPGAFAAIRAVQPAVQALYQLHKSLNVPPEVNTPDEFIANLEEAKPADQCPANFIRLVVAPDGKSYTVSIPAKRHERTFRTR